MLHVDEDILIYFEQTEILFRDRHQLLLFSDEVVSEQVRLDVLLVVFNSQLVVVERCYPS